MRSAKVERVGIGIDLSSLLGCLLLWASLGCNCVEAQGAARLATALEHNNILTTELQKIVQETRVAVNSGITGRNSSEGS